MVEGLRCEDIPAFLPAVPARPPRDPKLPRTSSTVLSTDMIGPGPPRAPARKQETTDAPQEEPRQRPGDRLRAHRDRQAAEFRLLRRPPCAC
ncbi:hypothetical protein QJS66_03935 [Kocuria rhizophila]|nr:hypothetical protein QJS66_03935 [Kocuria rhizophila]